MWGAVSSTAQIPRIGGVANIARCGPMRESCFATGTLLVAGTCHSRISWRAWHEWAQWQLRTTMTGLSSGDAVLPRMPKRALPNLLHSSWGSLLRRAHQCVLASSLLCQAVDIEAPGGVGTLLPAAGRARAAGVARGQRAPDPARRIASALVSVLLLCAYCAARRLFKRAEPPRTMRPLAVVAAQ